MQLFILLTNFILIELIEISAGNWLKRTEDIYHGYIFADELDVSIDPMLQIKLESGEEVCKFQLDGAEELPIEARVESAHLGLAKLVRTGPIKCLSATSANEADFVVRLRGLICGSSLWTTPATIHLKVMKPLLPKWSQSVYTVNISASRLHVGTAVVKVTAVPSKYEEADNRICRYNIEQQPRPHVFIINIHGVIRLVRRLDESQISVHNCITLLVSAEDCTLPKHHVSEVNVYVCVLHTKINPCHWSGLASDLKMTNLKIEPIGEEIHLANCASEESTNGKPALCTNENDLLKITTSIDLRWTISDNHHQQHHHHESYRQKTNGTSELNMHAVDSAYACSFHRDDVTLQIKICESHVAAQQPQLQVQSSWYRLLANLKSSANQFESAHFPLEENPQLIILPYSNQLTLYFWILVDKTRRRHHKYPQTLFQQKHQSGPGPNSDQVLLELQLVSEATNQCQLHLEYIVLGESMSDISKAYRLIYHQTGALCDDRWHLLLLTFDRHGTSTKVHLLIDAAPIEPSDVSIEPIQTGLSMSPMTQVILGQSTNYTHQFHGGLASAVLIPQLPEQSSTFVRCLMRCRDQLIFTGMAQLSPGMSVSLNSRMSSIIINSGSSSGDQAAVLHVSRLLQYISFAHLPAAQPTQRCTSLHNTTRATSSPITPQHPIIIVQTEIGCGYTGSYSIPTQIINISYLQQPSNTSLEDKYHSYRNNKQVYIAKKHFKLQVQPSVLSLDSHSASNLLSRGISIFSNMSFIGYESPPMTSEECGDSQMSNEIAQCHIWSDPPLDYNSEQFDWPRETIDSINTASSYIQVKSNPSSVLLIGPHSSQIYQFIVQNLRFINTNLSGTEAHIPPGIIYYQRTFMIQCAQITGRSSGKGRNTNIAAVKLEALPKTPLTVTIKPSAEPPYLNKGITAPLTSNARQPSKILDRSIVSNTHTSVFESVIGYNKLSGLSHVLLGIGVGMLALATFVGIMTLVSRRLLCHKSSRLERGMTRLLGVKAPLSRCGACCSLLSGNYRGYSKVKVELGRARCYHSSPCPLRDIGREMQWDDGAAARHCNIISNPLFKNYTASADDNLPPTCDSDEEFIYEEESDGGGGPDDDLAATSGHGDSQKPRSLVSAPSAYHQLRSHSTNEHEARSIQSDERFYRSLHKQILSSS